MAVIKLDGLIEILNRVKVLIDPDSEVTHDENLVKLSSGAINRDTGDAIEAPDSLISDFIPIKPGEYQWGCENSEIVALIVAYDANKNRVDGWADGSNYAYKADGGIIDFYEGVAFLRFSVGTTDDTITYSLTSGGKDYFYNTADELKTKFKKMQFKNSYDITTGEIDEDPTMHGLTIQRTGTNEMFNIVGVAAPTNNPREATISLTNFGENITQFVDITSMKYDDNAPGVVGMGIQARGNTPLPSFDLSFNDGTGPRHNLMVRPNSIPVIFTSSGIETKDENDNDVTVNLATLWANMATLQQLTYTDAHDTLLSAIYENAATKYGRLVTVTASVMCGTPGAGAWHTVFTGLPIPLVPNAIMTFTSRGGATPLRARVNEDGTLEMAGGASEQYYDIVYTYYN